MTIRYFCNICGEELLKNQVSKKIETWVMVSGKNVAEKVGIEIISGVGGTWNGGDLCQTHFREAVEKAISEYYGR